MGKEDVVCINNGILFSHEGKKKKILPFAKMRMGPESIMLSEVGQAEQNKHGLISLTC